MDKKLKDGRSLGEAYDALLEDYTSLRTECDNWKYKCMAKEPPDNSYKELLFKAQVREADLRNHLDKLNKRIEEQSIKILKLKKELYKRRSKDV